MTDRIGRRSFFRRASGLVAALSVPIFIPSTRLDFGVPREIARPTMEELLGLRLSDATDRAYLAAMGYSNASGVLGRRARAGTSDGWTYLSVVATTPGGLYVPADRLPRLRRTAPRQSVDTRGWSDAQFDVFFGTEV